MGVARTHRTINGPVNGPVTGTVTGPAASSVASAVTGLPQPNPQAVAVLDQRELVCSVIGLTVKLGLVIVAGVSLARLATAYQERMERQGELAAVLDLENAKLAKARERFDHLFMVEGEQRLIREQSQWIAPNRLRVVWRSTP